MQNRLRTHESSLLRSPCFNRKFCARHLQVWNKHKEAELGRLSDGAMLRQATRRRGQKKQR